MTDVKIYYCLNHIFYELFIKIRSFFAVAAFFPKIARFLLRRKKWK